MTLPLVLLLAATAFAAPAPRAAEPASSAPVKKKIRQLPGEEVQLQSRDGWTLTGTYKAAEAGKPTAILLHGGSGRRQDWYPFAVQMAKRGMGYLAFDLRGHGQSQNAPEGQPAQWNKFVVSKAYNEWDNMREDIAAAVLFLSTRGVAQEGMPVGGADVGANIALKYAAVHPEVPFLFLLSPSLNYREVLTPNAMRAYKARPVLIVVAEDDKRFTTEARILFNFAKQSAGEDQAFLMETPRAHGTKMFAFDRELAGRILDWVADPAGYAAKQAGEGEEAGEEEAPPAEETPKPKEGELPSDEELDKALKKGGEVTE